MHAVLLGPSDKGACPTPVQGLVLRPFAHLSYKLDSRAGMARVRSMSDQAAHLLSSHTEGTRNACTFFQPTTRAGRLRDTDRGSARVAAGVVQYCLADTGAAPEEYVETTRSMLIISSLPEP